MVLCVLPPVEIFRKKPSVSACQVTGQDSNPPHSHPSMLTGSVEGRCRGYLTIWWIQRLEKWLMFTELVLYCRFCSMCLYKHHLLSSSWSPNKIVFFIIPILWMKEPRHREVTCLKLQRSSGLGLNFRTSGTTACAFSFSATSLCRAAGNYTAN